MRTATLITILAFTGVLQATAQDHRPTGQGTPPTLEDLERQRRPEKLQSTGDRLKVMVDEMVQEKRAQCVRAFGHSSFCDCLSSEMPVGASFLTCVRVVTTTKDALSYSDLDKDDRQLVDTIIKARELCVRKGHAAQWK